MDAASLPVPSRPICWRRAVILFLSLAVVIAILLHHPTRQYVLRTREWRRSPQRRSAFAHSPGGPAPESSALFLKPAARERARHGDFDDAERAIIKKYRCKFVDAWTATRTNPEAFAVFSLLRAAENGSMELSLQRLEVLGYSLKVHAPGVPHYVMLHQSRHGPERWCSSTCQRRLHDSGWRLCRAPVPGPAAAPSSSPPSSRHPSGNTANSAVDEQFIQLVLWNVIQFRHVAYLDNQVLVTGSLETLRTRVARELPIASLPAYQRGERTTHIDPRVAVIRTSAQEYLRLHKRLLVAPRATANSRSVAQFLDDAYAKVRIDLPTGAERQWLTEQRPNAGTDDVRGQGWNSWTSVPHWLWDGATFQPQMDADKYMELWNAAKQEMCTQRCASSTGRSLAAQAQCNCAQT